MTATVKSPKEISEEDRVRHEALFSALKIIEADAKGQYGVQGSVTCPLCKGKLSYSIAKLNGHIWGVCETEDCLRWMM